jgi:O-antigen ligase
MAILLAAVAVLIPLAIAPGLLFYFDVTPKVVVLLTGTAAALLMMPKRKAPVPSLSKWFLALLAIYGFALLVSTIRSTDWQLSLMGANWRRFGLLSHITALSFAAVALFTLAGRPEARLLLLRAIAGGGLIASGYGTLQYFGHDPWLPNGSYTIGEGEWAIVRPPATLGHASYAATCYLFAIFAGLGVARTDARRIWRSIGTAATVIGTFAIVLSGTRAAVLGLLAGSAGLVLFSPPRWKGRAAALGLIALASFGVFYYSPAGERLRARMRWSIEDAQGGARLLLWRDSLRMAAAHPILGWGPETFTREFPKASRGGRRPSGRR